VGARTIHDATETHPHLALIVLDGLGDLPHPDTAGRSPVVAAQTPNLDHLLAAGQSGEVIVIGPGIAPESDAGVLALLGYDPVRDSPGRGVLEAEGVGISLGPGDIALRLNFATIDGDGRVLDSRVGRTLGTAEATELARSLNQAELLVPEGIKAEVRPTVGHRGVLWLHSMQGGRLSDQVSNSDPFYEKVGGMGQAKRVPDPHVLVVRPLVDTPEAQRTARALNDFTDRSVKILAGHRVNARRALSGRKIANGLLLRNAGARTPGVPAPFQQKFGLEGSAVTEMPVERGIARLLGLVDLYVGPMGPDRAAGFRDRAEATRSALEKYPFVYVHLKGPDEPGHDGNARLKQEIIEAIDAAFFGPFSESLDWSKYRIAVTADHATPCVRQGHSDDPVPLLLVGAGVPPQKSTAPLKFGDAAAAGGILGTRRGNEVLALLRQPPPAPP
jgi:2,3-bisphosphoglycerate-independent phosphoglycerate mutase